MDARSSDLSKRIVLPALKVTATAPENGWLEDEFCFGMAPLQVRTVSFREGNT